MEYQSYKPSYFDKNMMIPEGWEEMRLKFAASYNDESLPETTDEDYELSYVDISSVSLIGGISKRENITFEKAPSRARRIVKHGDTIISTVRTYLKAIAAIKNPPENLVVSTGFAVIRPYENIDKNYLSYFLQSEKFVNQVVAYSVGVSYPAINPSDLVCLPVYFPRLLEEQQKIAAFLDHKTQKIDELIKRIGSASTKSETSLVGVLQEYRSALITAAVTGKIDIRNWQQPTEVI